MITAIKEFTFDCAHMLADHKGKCSNLHGHTYKLQVTVGRQWFDTINNEGMVMDFGEIKEIVQRAVIDKFDHATIINTQSVDEFELELLQLLKKHNKKVVEINFKPTAELLAKYIQHLLMEAFIKKDVYVMNVRLWETPTSFVEVE